MFDDENELQLYEDFLMLARQHPQKNLALDLCNFAFTGGIPIAVDKSKHAVVRLQILLYPGADSSLTALISHLI